MTSEINKLIKLQEWLESQAIVFNLSLAVTGTTISIVGLVTEYKRILIPSIPLAFGGALLFAGSSALNYALKRTSIGSEYQIEEKQHTK